MKVLLLLIPFLLITNTPPGENGVSEVTVSDMQAIAAGANAQELIVSYDYWFLGGVSEEIHIFGDGRMYYRKSVHTKKFQDALNDAHNNGVRISPYLWSLANCEYGDYDIYEWVDLSETQIQVIADSIAVSGVLENESQYGDVSYHGLTIQLPGRETIKSGVFLSEFPQLNDVTTYLVEDLKGGLEMKSCSKSDFTQAINGA